MTPEEFEQSWRWRYHNDAEFHAIVHTAVQVTEAGMISSLTDEERHMVIRAASSALLLREMPKVGT